MLASFLWQAFQMHNCCTTAGCTGCDRSHLCTLSIEALNKQSLRIKPWVGLFSSHFLSWSPTLLSLPSLLWSIYPPCLTKSLRVINILSFTSIVLLILNSHLQLHCKYFFTDSSTAVRLTICITGMNNSNEKCPKLCWKTGDSNSSWKKSRWGIWKRSL